MCDKKGFLLIEALLFLGILSFLVLCIITILHADLHHTDRYEQVLNNSMMKELYAYE